MNNALNQVTNVFRETREDLHLSREKVSELSVILSPRQIEKIEKDQYNSRPEDILILADLYRRPKLLNHYCSSICPIGKRQIPDVAEKTLPEIVTTILICSEYIECNRSKAINDFMDYYVNRRVQRRLGVMTPAEYYQAKLAA